MTRDEATERFLKNYVDVDNREAVRRGLDILLDLIEVRAMRKATAEIMGDLTRVVAGKVS